MYYITRKDIKLPKRESDSHKGDNGTVLVVGGSRNFVGAVTLAGLAALRSGADLVKIVAPEKVAWAINAYSPDIITKKFPSEIFLPIHFSIIKEEINKFDVSEIAKAHTLGLKSKASRRMRVSEANSLTSHGFPSMLKNTPRALARGRVFDILLIGNGIGLNKETKKFCKMTIRNIKKLKVIDADAIKSISMDDAENSIITPHSKELEYFLINSKVNKSIINEINNESNISRKSKLIKKITQKFLDKNNIILLKGKIDIIISKNKIFYNKTGNAGMTKGGTGDVLAGLCAGFLAQSKDLLQSAVNAAYFNGLIGDILLKKKKGFSYLASDMVEEIKRISY